MKVAIIGLGHMGMGMARNLVKAGHAVTAFDLAKPAMDAAAQAGMATAASGPQAAADVDVVITVLPAGKHVLAAYRGEHGDDGLLGAARKGTLFMDCSTIGVDETREAAGLAREAGQRAIDAPISGGMVGADDGTLTFMVGGDAADFDFVKPLTAAMGRHAVYCGDHGAGLIAKICNNMLLCINQIGAAEAFNLGARLGMDPKKLFEIFSTSTSQSWSVTTNSPVPGTVADAPSSHDFAPGAVPHTLAKDLGLAAKAMETAGYHCQLGSQARELYGQMTASKFAEQDFSGIINYLAWANDQGTTTG
ncbi:MAG: 3-hydroxyisobutyrate dehydrogenase [Xanthomonadales bacterium]|nr:3-hydroxyisobutyrate dehydrogenase [Xanthomonadales bacterium]